MKTLSRNFNDYIKTLHRSSAPSYIYDAKTLEFIEVNNAACEKYGYTPEEFHTLTMMDLYPEKDRSKFYVDMTMLDKMRVYYGNWKHRKKNGELVPVKVIADKIVLQNKDAWFVTIKTN